MRLIVLGASSCLAQQFMRQLNSEQLCQTVCFYRNHVVDLASKIEYRIKQFEDYKKFIVDNTIMLNFLCSYGSKNEDFNTLNYVNYILPLKFYRELEKTDGSIFFNCGTVLPDDYNDYALTKNKLYNDVRYSNRATCRFHELSIQAVYGFPGTNKSFIDFLINACMKSHNKVDIRSPRQKREFIHIFDFVAALKILVSNQNLLHDRVSNINIGSSEVMVIEELCELIKNSIGSDCEFSMRESKPYEISSSDLSVLHSLGWTQKYTINHYISYVANNYKGSNSENFIGPNLY